MVVHCFGATTFLMALLAGLRGVRSVVVSQIATDVFVPWFPQRLLVHLRMPTLLGALGARVLDARASDRDPWWLRALDRMIHWLYPIQAEERTGSATSNRITVLYGQLFERDQLNQATFESGLPEMFGKSHIKPLKHLARIARRTQIVNCEGRDVYLPNIARLNLPVCFIHGEENACFQSQSTLKTYRRLSARFGPGNFSRHVIPGYGHIDCIFGANAAQDVYPHILEHLDSTQHGSAVSAGGISRAPASRSRPTPDDARRRRLDVSADMDPVTGSADVAVPADVLWAQFKRARFWPRWNRCFFWCRNADLTAGQKLVWAFEPIRTIFLYKFPAIATIVEVSENDPALRRVTWEVTALPGFYARHSYSVEDLGNGHSRFASWEKAEGWCFRVFRWFWLAHFRFVRNRSLDGAHTLESEYLRENALDVSSLARRRYFGFWASALAIFALLGGIGVATWAYTSFIRLTTTTIAPGVSVVMAGGGNSVVVEDGDSLFLIDSKFPPASLWLRDEITNRWNAPVTRLVNTHYHYDHTQGNELYESAAIIAHKDVPALMVTRDGGYWQAGRLGFVPKHLIDGEAELRVGGHRVLLHHPGPAHTQADLVIVFPDLDIVVLGDLMFNGYYPFFDEGEGGVALEGMVDALRRIAQDYPNASFVPGHGPLATAADVVHYADYIDHLRVHVQQALSDGRDVDEAEASLDLSGWNFGILPSFHNSQLKWATAASNVRAIYRLLSAANRQLGQRADDGQS